MKILMINVTCGIKSTGRICTDLAEALTRKGHEVKIAYGRGEVPKRYQKYAIKIGNKFDFYSHALKARLFDASGFGSKKATKKFIEWVKDYDPDVIHLHNIHGYYLNIEILFDYLRNCGKRIIWTLHDCWSFTGHTSYCDVVACKRWKSGCHNCPLLKEYPKSFVDRSKQNWEKKKELFEGIPGLSLVAPSNWLASWVKESFLKNYDVEVIHNGIDTAQFKPMPSDFKKQHGIEGKIMLVGVATAWDENKGLSDYLRLANMLGSQYQIVLVGVSEKQKLGLPKRVLAITKTNNVKELAQIYSAADFALNLSKTENYPTVNLEAMCCNTPVITYDIGGSKESVRPSGGVVVERGDLNAVVEAIKGKRAQCHIDNIVFDKSLAVEKYVQLIKNSFQQLKN